MNREQLLSSVWVRILVFAWIVVFPIVFIALPAFEMFMGDGETSWTPVWGLIIWMMGPWAGSILMKYVGSNSTSEFE